MYEYLFAALHPDDIDDVNIAEMGRWVNGLGADGYRLHTMISNDTLGIFLAMEKEVESEPDS